MTMMHTRYQNIEIVMLPTAEVFAMVPGDGYDGETMEEVLDRKRTDPEYDYAQLLRDIERDGIEHPLELYMYAGKMYLSNGHHRFAAAVELGMEYVPVVYDYVSVPSSPYYKGWS